MWGAAGSPSLHTPALTHTCEQQLTSLPSVSLFLFPPSPSPLPLILSLPPFYYFSSQALSLWVSFYLCSALPFSSLFFLPSLPSSFSPPNIYSPSYGSSLHSPPLAAQVHTHTQVVFIFYTLFSLYLFSVSLCLDTPILTIVLQWLIASIPYSNTLYRFVA